MRVVHLARSVAPFAQGHTARGIAALARAQARMGLDVSVLTAGPGAEASSTGQLTEVFRGVTYQFLGSAFPLPERPDGGRLGASAERERAFQRSLCAGLWSDPPDVVHAHGTAGAAYLGLRRRRPTVVSAYPSDGYGRGSHLDLVLGFTPTGEDLFRSLKLADAVLVQSAEEAEVIHGFCRGEPRVMGPGVDLAAAAQARKLATSARLGLGLAPRDFAIAVQGDYGAGRGLLADALRRLTRRGIAWTLVVLGETRGWLRIAESLSSCGRVCLTGAVPCDRAATLLAACDCLALPGGWEQGPVLLEALSLGVPVVGFPCGAFEQLVEPGVNGLPVRRKDPEVFHLLAWAQFRGGAKEAALGTLKDALALLPENDPLREDLEASRRAFEAATPSAGDGK